MPKNLSQAEVNEFRQRLCAVAEKRFGAQGPDGVTMRDLARDLGVSPMTPYRYFHDKEEILAAVRAAAFDRFAEALEQAGRIKGDAAALSDAIGHAYIRFAFAEPNAYRLMFDMAQRDEQRFPDLARAGQRAARTMSAHLEELVAAGLLEGDPVLLGYAFWAALHGLVVLHLAGKLPAKPDFDTLYEETMRLLIDGARPRRPVKTAPSSTRSSKRNRRSA